MPLRPSLRLRMRSGRRLPLRLTLALGAALGAPAALAAAFLPGPATGDPPTGATPEPAAPTAAEPTAALGNGIRWQFAPWRWRGTAALDLRWIDSGQGRTLRQAVSTGDMEFASYVWQPWFVQVRAGVGLVLARGSSSSADNGGTSDGSLDLTGRLHVSVFPASRFPFELRADLGDSRASGETLVTDFRTLRVSLSQSYQPLRSADSYTLGLDHSRVSASSGVGDSLTVLRGTALKSWPNQTLEGMLAFSDNHSHSGDASSRLGLVTARHAWTPFPSVSTETLASWSDSRLRSGGPGRTLDLGFGVVQLSSLATYRPRAGDWGYDEQAPLSVAAAVRLSETRVGRGDATARAQAVNLSAGFAKDLSRHWRSNGGLTWSRVDGGGSGPIDISALNLALSWSPEPVTVLGWRWTPASSLSGTLNQAPDGQRRTLGLQGSHSLSRSWPLDGQQALAFNVSQSVGTVTESPTGRSSRGLAHGLGLHWQSLGGEGTSQSFASLSLSDSRNRAELDGHFRFVNLQFNRRTQLSRFASWSASVTAQATRSDIDLVDPFTGERRRQDDGWQKFYSATLSYESQRFAGVPRLRFTLLASANTQQLERRAGGDLDAPLERSTESLEARLDHAVGRLDLRLSARAARIEGRTVAALMARAQRRF